MFPFVSHNYRITLLWRYAPWDLLYHLLVVKAVEKGQEQAFHSLTMEGPEDISFDAMEVDDYEPMGPRSFLSFFSDIREGETLYEMATRIWGEDETKAGFLDAVRDATRHGFHGERLV